MYQNDFETKADITYEHYTKTRIETAAEVAANNQSTIEADYGVINSDWNNTPSIKLIRTVHMTIHNYDNTLVKSTQTLTTDTNHTNVNKDVLIGEIGKGGVTKGVGVGLSAHAVGGVNVGKGIYWDEIGNIAILESESVTATSDIELSANIYYEKAKYATVNDLIGISVIASAGGEIPMIPIFGANHEKSFSSPDSKIISSITSLSLNAGISPVEIQTGLSETKVKFLINTNTGEGIYNGKLLGYDLKVNFNYKKFDLRMRWE